MAIFKEICGIRRLLAGLALSGALACAIAGAGASRAAAAEAGVGLNSPTSAQLGAVHALGTHWVRMFVSWRALQPTPAPVSAPVIASYEQLFAALPAGTKVILDIFATPQWESGSANENAPPANPGDYAAFVASLARHWAGRVTAYEIWNEEDAPAWWVGGPDPAAYVRLLAAAYPAIKAADPHAKVVLGGLTGNDYAFLAGVYQAGGKGFFDAVGVHTDTACSVLSPYQFLRGPDNRMIFDSFLAYREVRATMLAHGDDKPIWMTELSWLTTRAVCAAGVWAGQKPEGVSDSQQATFLRQAYHCLAQDPYVQVALWFPVQDEGGVLSGLVRAGGSHKPSFAAMRSYTRDGDKLREPCGSFGGPSIRVATPGARQGYEGPLPIRVHVASSQGVWRLTLLIDGRLIRHFGGHTYPRSLDAAMTWFGARRISRGAHKLTFLAYDREHNRSKVSVAIYHGRRHARSAHRKAVAHHADVKHSPGAMYHLY
jgi:hypothetical protein